MRWRPNVVDYRDGAGIGRWVTCDTRRQAQDVLSEKLRESRQASRPAVDPDITVAAYLARWETLIGSFLPILPSGENVVVARAGGP